MGCGVLATRKQSGEVKVTGDPKHPANQGNLCIKGSHLKHTLVAEGRLGRPYVAGQPVSWDQALAHTAQSLGHVVQEHGAQAVAFYLSGQLLTEDYYVANKLMKGFIGSPHVDTNSRLCMASAVAAHKRAFGEDVVPCSYSDLDEADLVVLVGSNLNWAHPILFQRLRHARASRGTQIIVIDPRETETCEIADLHLPLQSDSDLALFNGLLTYLNEIRAVDQAYLERNTIGAEDTFAQAEIGLSEVSERTGLSEALLLAFYNVFADTKKVVTVFSQGINQSRTGTDQCNAIINCHLATGRIGQPGAGPFSITGQPNAMGGREVGGMATQLAAHMDYEPESIDRVRRFWDAPNIADRPGHKAVEMFQAIKRGEIKAVWIMGTNPAVSLPDRHEVIAALQVCPLVIVSDCMSRTDTTRFADVLLPAQSWGEKDGTVTNSERVISRQRGFMLPHEMAKPDWWIVTEIAKRLGYEREFKYRKPADIFFEHAELSGFENSGDRLFNIAHLAAIGTDGYEVMEPVQWPATRPFSDGRFSRADRKAAMIPTLIRSGSPVPTVGELVLNTGRFRDHWHTMTRTGLVDTLFEEAAEPLVSIHPLDAAGLGIEENSLVCIANDLGELRMPVELSDSVGRGSVFVPIHWAREFASHSCVSDLVSDCVDPVSGQPASKSSIVGCKSMSVTYWVRLATNALIPSERLTCALYWCRIPMGDGYVYELAVDEGFELEKAVSAQNVVTYHAENQVRLLGRHRERASWILFAAGDRHQLPTRRHVMHQLSESSAADWRRLGARTDAAVDVSRRVCSCFDVSEQAIAKALANGIVTIDGLGDSLKCGTNCGSCLPQIRELIARETLPTQQAVVG